ncbi:MAG: hypothetical protein MRY83_23980 [Flavobacteriales bacterium]|nr:hypothetical protein [Flavobacteriales bacterium]
MEFTKEQLDIIKASDHKASLELKGNEVFAIYSLGQMHNKVVRMTDNFFNQTKVVVFTIDHINGESNLNFDNPEDWKEVNLERISFTITCPTEFGSSYSKFERLNDIKEIALLQ